MNDPFFCGPAMMSLFEGVVESQQAKPAANKTVLLRTMENKLVRIEVKDDPEQLGSLAVGSYKGKQGTIRRNAKGRTRIMPNGWRKYQVQWYNNEETVGYKVA